MHDVEIAISALAQGKSIVVVDAKDRENEGDIVVLAEHATPGAINFMITHGRGLVTLAMSGVLLDTLEIPMPPTRGKLINQCAFTVTIDAAVGITTGTSAFDRSHTILTTVNDAAKPEDIVMPGHILPLRAREGGVRERAGHTEAAVELAVLANAKPAAVLCEILNEDGSMTRPGELVNFAVAHGMPYLTVEALIDYLEAMNDH